MKKLKLIGLLSVFLWTMQACNRSNQRTETDNSKETTTDYNVDTADTGKDTLGFGDSKGSDHTQDIPRSE
jgi:hypothetical protein